MKPGILFFLIATAMAFASIAWGEQVKSYPLDSMDAVISRDAVVLDQVVSSDGNGSLRIETDRPKVVALFQTGDIDVENSRLFYQAKLKTRGLKGRAYLEMWCVFENNGRYFSRGLNDPVSGDTDWVGREIPFILQKGQNPINVELNLVIQGKGTVWIDDIRLITLPMP